MELRPYRAMKAIAILILLLAGTAAAQQTPSPSSDAPPSSEENLRRELDELRARQRWLEQRLGATEARLPPARNAQASKALPVPPEAMPADDSIPHYRFGHGGFVFGSADGRNEIRFRLTLHVDGRAYFGGTQPIPDTFLIRRARPFIEGTLWGVIGFRLMPDFALGSAVLQDGYIDLKPWTWLRLRVGKFMVPIGLEWLQSDSTILMVERSLATDLVPFRDLGVMLMGEVGNGTFCYQLAVVNGAVDSGNGPDLDLHSEKDYVGRVFLRPLRLTRLAPLADLGFGVAGSYGSVKGVASNSNLPTYRSPGQQTIFTYINNPTTPDAALAAGDRWRVTPQLYWYIGPVGLMAEYVLSAQRVSRLGTTTDLQHQAWNLTASFVMTLEHASYEGVTPKYPVDFRHKNFGAVELTLRYSELRLDPNAFPLFADPLSSVQSARELAGGINWYLTDYVRFMLSFHHTSFGGGAATGDREPENALLGRLQISL
jgi:phosphate-selective porin OprO/OprP